MTDADRLRFRWDLFEATPECDVSVRFHGAPKAAPSVPKRGTGYFAFRTWGRVYVTVSPARSLTWVEHDAIMVVIRRWNLDLGFSIVEGPNHEWPILGDDTP